MLRGGNLILAKFIFCIQMRTGCILIGALGILGRSWAGIGNGIGWIYIVPLETLDPWRSIISITNGLVGIIGGVTLLCGAIKTKKTLIKMYLPITSCLIVLLTISASLGIYTMNYLCSLSSACACDKYFIECIWIIYTLSLDVIDVFAYLYFIVCVYSYLHQVNQQINNDEQFTNHEHLMMS